MFTGIIQQLGNIKAKRNIGGGMCFALDAGTLHPHLSVGDSIAINGVCLTVTKKRTAFVEVEAVEETLKKTTLGAMRVQSKINCELPLRPNDFVGPHFVLGHVDCVGTVLRIEQRSTSWLFTFSYPKEFISYLIPRGSIAIDGVSLTVVDIIKNTFSVSIIPHTFENTNFRFFKPSSNVNLEFDMLGKYVVELMKRKP